MGCGVAVIEFKGVRREDVESKDSKRVTYLNRSDLDTGGIPSLPFPTLGTHGPQTQKGYRPISFPQLDAISNLY